MSEEKFAEKFPLCLELGLYGTAGDMEAVWAIDVERLLRDAPVAYGFGSPNGSMTLSTDLQERGSCEVKARVIMAEALEKKETAADLLRMIVAVNGDLSKDSQLSHGHALGLRPEFIERCKRVLGL